MCMLNDEKLVVVAIEGTPITAIPSHQAWEWWVLGEVCIGVGVGLRMCRNSFTLCWNLDGGMRN